jgi:hypothetical protein
MDRLHKRTRPYGAFLLTVACVAFGSVAAASTSSDPASASVANQILHLGHRAAQTEPHGGIVPPMDPPSNEPPNPQGGESCNDDATDPLTPDNSVSCTENVLAAIDNARASEGVSPMSFDLAAFEAMTPSEQLFVVANLERVDRDLQPIPYLTSQLDGYAQTGADNNEDPGDPASLTSGAYVSSYGSIWAGNFPNVLWADYVWMYDDGPGGPNEDCTTSYTAGCWGHRNNILWPNPDEGCFLAMGAATSVVEDGLSYAALVVDACGAEPTDQVFTWPEAVSALSGNGHLAVATQALVSPSSFLVRYSDWLEVENPSGSYSWSVTAGALPPGYSLSAAGQLTGPISDSGTFTFSVTVTETTSPFQSASASLDLTFANSTSVAPLGPPPALLIRASSTAGGSVTIRIARSEPKGFSPITEYQYSINSGRWTGIVANHFGTFSIHRLTPDRSYYVRLRAINAVGIGRASNRVRVKVD